MCHQVSKGTYEPALMYDLYYCPVESGLSQFCEKTKIILNNCEVGISRSRASQVIHAF